MQANKNVVNNFWIKRERARETSTETLNFFCKFLGKHSGPSETALNKILIKESMYNVEWMIKHKNLGGKFILFF